MGAYNVKLCYSNAVPIVDDYTGPNDFEFYSIYTKI